MKLFIPNDTEADSVLVPGALGSRESSILLRSVPDFFIDLKGGKSYVEEYYLRGWMTKKSKRRERGVASTGG